MTINIHRYGDRAIFTPSQGKERELDTVSSLMKFVRENAKDIKEMKITLGELSVFFRKVKKEPLEKSAETTYHEIIFDCLGLALTKLEVAHPFDLFDDTSHKYPPLKNLKSLKFSCDVNQYGLECHTKNLHLFPNLELIDLSNGCNLDGLLVLLSVLVSRNSKMMITYPERFEDCMTRRTVFFKQSSKNPLPVAELFNVFKTSPATLEYITSRLGVKPLPYISQDFLKSKIEQYIEWLSPSEQKPRSSKRRRTKGMESV